MAAMRIVAEQPKGLITTKGNDEEQGNKELISLVHGQEKSMCPLEKLNNAWVELYSHLHANNLQLFI